MNVKLDITAVSMLTVLTHLVVMNVSVKKASLEMEQYA